ncbi:MAG: ATP-binding protein [Tannerella sp.]|nr:ATP-binding protein [Tannerella sp.]
MKRTHPIKALIAQGEHQQLDFKFAVNDCRKIARTLSAFANTDGGRLLIGVRDNGHITGVRDDEEYYMIEAAARLYTKPCVTFSARRWDVNSRSVLEICVAPSADKPHLAPCGDGACRAYIRVADENMLADEVLLLAWKKQRNPSGTLLKLSRPVEKLLLYLDTHPSIHLSQFCRLAHIRRATAQNILSDLLAIGSLRYVVDPHGVRYERIAP